MYDPLYSYTQLVLCMLSGFVRVLACIAQRALLP